MLQGSVLRPILFLLYINDIVNLDMYGQFTLFADDATILWNGTDEQTLTHQINYDLCLMKNWCDANKLLLNILKTNVVPFKCNLGPVYVENQILKETTQSRFLGLIVDHALRFAMLFNAYFALIESHLRYGVCFWGSCTVQLLHAVFVLQKRAVGHLSGAKPGDSCRPLFVANRILTSPSSFTLETLCHYA